MNRSPQETQVRRQSSLGEHKEALRREKVQSFLVHDALFGLEIGIEEPSLGA